MAVTSVALLDRCLNASGAMSVWCSKGRREGSEFQARLAPGGRDCTGLSFILSLCGIRDSSLPNPRSPGTQTAAWPPGIGLQRGHKKQP